MQYYPMAEPRHFFWALMPMIGPFAYFLLLTARGRILPVAIALVILAVPLCVTRANQAVQLAQRRFWTIPGGSVLAGMAVPEAEAPACLCCSNKSDKSSKYLPTPRYSRRAPMPCGGASSEIFATRPLSMSSGARFPGPELAAGIRRPTLKCATRFATHGTRLCTLRIKIQQC